MADWVDIAWSHMLEQAPLMGDPGRWRTMMYEVFWLGKEPELTPEEREAQRERQVADAQASIGKGYSATAIAEMDALLKQASELRAQQAE